ncbi:MAG: hypothetical protein OEZ43_03015 [Gammaproteobacteria bacterium]|nr:hypothetical protein [Gammaproteobacteria bacterium]
MAGKKSPRRAQKKEILRRFDDSFDLIQLDLGFEVKRIKPKAMLYGLLTAFTLYGIAFSLTYYAMSNNNLPLDLFSKLVWVIMIPTTIVGFFVWQLSRNRMEYPVRMRIREYIHAIESKGGLLWRFSPLLDLLPTPNPDVKKAFAYSEQDKIEKLDIDDYILAVDTLRELLFDSQSNRFTSQLAEKLEDNFSQQTRAA